MERAGCSDGGLASAGWLGRAVLELGALQAAGKQGAVRGAAPARAGLSRRSQLADSTAERGGPAEVRQG